MQWSHELEWDREFYISSPVNETGTGPYLVPGMRLVQESRRALHCCKQNSMKMRRYRNINLSSIKPTIFATIWVGSGGILNLPKLNHPKYLKTDAEGIYILKVTAPYKAYCFCHHPVQEAYKLVINMIEHTLQLFLCRQFVSFVINYTTYIINIVQRNLTFYELIYVFNHTFYWTLIFF